MAVKLSVRDVRDAINNLAGVSGNGAPSTALLGRLFHEVFAELAGRDATRNFRAAIADAEPELDQWRRALVEHTYHQLVGPRLRQNQAVLHHVTEQVLTFWDAVLELCDWIAELMWRLRERGQQPALSDFVGVEQPLSWEVREPGWRESVVLNGVADAVWRVPGGAGWCVLELKTGRSAPEADLAQVCLYHQMLAAANGAALGHLALVAFEPKKKERLFTAQELSEAQTQLKKLIGVLAGVVGTAAETKRAARDDEQRRAESEFARIAAPTPEHEQLGRKLVQTLREYGAEVRLEPPIIAGPAFVRFHVTPGKRVKLNAVERLAKEVQVRLKLDAPPRIGTENGRVVIDVQRPDRQTVHFAAIRPQLPERDPLFGSAQVPLGVDLAGRLRLVDFARAEDCHLLAAGLSGSGKSEWLRSAIAGLLLTNTPDTLRLLVIDPKRNAFTALRQSPFLLRPIAFPDEEPAAKVFGGLIAEMERRFRLFELSGADDFPEHIKRTGQSLPRIFCVCDEYADLLTGDRRTRRALEEQIIRLGQKARAAGIHLLVATQQPSREIIKGALEDGRGSRGAHVQVNLPRPGAGTRAGRSRCHA